MNIEDIRARHLSVFKLAMQHCDRIEADAKDEELNPDDLPPMMDTSAVRKYLGEMVELFGMAMECERND